MLRDCVDGGAGDVVVDLRRVVSIGALGLSALLDAHKRLRRSGGGLVVRHPPSSTRRVLEITGLSEVLGERPWSGAAGGG